MPSQKLESLVKYLSRMAETGRCAPSATVEVPTSFLSELSVAMEALVSTVSERRAAEVDSFLLKGHPVQTESSDSLIDQWNTQDAPSQCLDESGNQISNPTDTVEEQPRARESDTHRQWSD